MPCIHGTADMEPFKRSCQNDAPHLLIFSKDRACQLDSLLRSIKDHFVPLPESITVLYKTTTPEFLKGYRILEDKKIFAKAQFIKEQKFEQDVHRVMAGFSDDSLVMFFVDDNIVFKQCDVRTVLDAFTQKHLFVSTRVSRNYPQDTAPVFLQNDSYLEWKWNYNKRHWVTWNYPFSVDGNIFHGNHIKKIIQKISFSAPNSFEGHMHFCRHAWWIKRIPLALSLKDVSVFNNPLNKVQTEGETWHKEVTAEYLNEKYCDGYCIDNTPIYNSGPTATHFSAMVSFVKLF